MENTKKMTLRFLGTGTSTGVPQINCQCPVCTSADVRDQRLRASVMLSDGVQQVLIDCGPDFRQQALQASINHLDAVLLTHEHYDHMGGLDDLRPLGDVPIYAEKRVQDAVHRCLPYCFGVQLYPGVPQITLRLIQAGQPFSVGSWQVQPIRVMHAQLPIVGYRIGKMAYLTDVKSLPEESMQQLKNLDVLILDALRMKATHPSHISLEEALALVERLKPKRAYFTHFSHGIGLHAATQATLPANIYLAYDGLQIEY